MPPVGDRLRDRWLVPLRRALGDAAADVALAAGRTLSLEQAIAEALAPNTTLERQWAGHRSDILDGLTPRELEVLRLVAAGQSNRESLTNLC